MNRPALIALRDQIRVSLAGVEKVIAEMDSAIQVGCATCGYYDALGKCAKYDATPPEDVRKVGCDEWDGVPF